VLSIPKIAEIRDNQQIQLSGHPVLSIPYIAEIRENLQTRQAVNTKEMMMVVLGYYFHFPVIVYRKMMEACC
jgi:hypothetical protein